MRTHFLTSLLLLTLATFSRAQNVRVPVELDSALGFIGLTSDAFIADRIWMDDDTYLLSKLREAMKSPQHAWAVSQQVAAAAPQTVAEAGKVNQLFGFVDAQLPEAVTRDIDAQLNAAKPTQVDVFEPMLSAFALSNAYLGQAFQALSYRERELVVMAAPLWFEDEDIAADDTLKGMLQRALGSPSDTATRFDADSIVALLPKINRGALAAASYAFGRGLAMTTERWKSIASPFKTGIQSGVEGLVIEARETAFGTFVLGGSGPNTYNGEFALIIDLGGDDRYLGRCATAIGSGGRNLSAAIDFKGNDDYAGNKIANLSCAVLGVSGLVDLDGDDDYHSGAFSQGAAFCGSAFFFDGAGNDTFRAGLFAQGAAVCGVAVVADGLGRDIYDAHHSCQAFASTFGAAVLVDGAGNDVYRAGGAVLHAPLRPEDYRSLAQGFAIGARPLAAGGIALLNDKSGNDFYNGEIYAQGVGYWYSLGALIDEAGNDAYDATQYSQGAGIHLAAGVLEDVSGDDRYGSRFGPGQGGAHDLAVGFLYDHTGDDQYISSGGRGMAITNSGAIFMDNRGNDIYAASERDYSQGAARAARSFGNLGAFVDGEGKDTYVNGGADSSLWTQGVFAIGYDVSHDSTSPREAQPDVALDPADTLRQIEELFREASLWEVTDNREKVRRARLALNAKGVAAVQWVGEHKMGTVESLERRAIIELFKEYKVDSWPYIEAALNHENIWQRRNAVGILSELKYQPAVPVLLAKLTDASYAKVRPGIITAIGDIGDTSATLQVIPFTASSSERERIAAVSSLGKLQDRRGYEAMFESILDSQYTVRSAAIYAIAAQDKRVLLQLDQEFSRRETDRLENLLLACAAMGERWKGVDSLQNDLKLLTPTVKRYLDHPEPRVQSAAILAVSKVSDAAAFQKTVGRFEKSSDPLVRGRYRQALNSYH